MVERAALIQEIDTFSLEKAAEMAAEEYRLNSELTSFTALDGVDFYETR